LLRGLALAIREKMNHMKEGKLFTREDALLLEEIILNRRDVRGNHFIDKELDESSIDKLVDAALNAPSVGFSQPWEFVVVKDKHIKQQIKESFETAHVKEAGYFKDKKQEDYVQLKLEGILESAVNIAVFYKPSQEPVLGQTNMKEAGLFSVVCAIQNMWLMARALNIGMGWVSILNADKVKTILNAPVENQLIAYLCIGHVDRFLTEPELETLKWEKRKEKENVIFFNQYK
jgi:5,6-dimethylbenzimidazole synthase